MVSATSFTRNIHICGARATRKSFINTLEWNFANTILRVRNIVHCFIYQFISRCDRHFSDQGFDKKIPSLVLLTTRKRVFTLEFLCCADGERISEVAYFISKKYVALRSYVV